MFFLAGSFLDFLKTSGGEFDSEHQRPQTFEVVNVPQTRIQLISSAALTLSLWGRVGRQRVSSHSCAAVHVKRKNLDTIIKLFLMVIDKVLIF